MWLSLIPPPAVVKCQRLHPYLPSDCFTTVMCGLVTMRFNYFKILLARLTAKLFPPQFVVNAEAGLLIELRTVILASPAFSTSQAWKMVVMACVLLVLIFKVFNYVVSGLEIILSLKSDYMVPPPKTVFV